ncbi:peroxisomal biogenesis factor 3-like [Tigriopus californicus]|uniref:peroxisomal biogenesis factor 3-like n=1 Tax=Tigriopus californicus TaxID=6832 RepID=UPI0027DA9FDC|nr:peroxisomal biogenesis factor 3-like [Tigriopus californicus]
MLGKAWQFARRHKTKIAAVSAITGGLVLAGKLAESKFKQWQEEETRKMLEQIKKQHHYENTEKTSNETLKSLFPALIKTIEKSLDSEPILERIKNQTGNKIELWNELKVLSFARALAMIITGTQLVLLLKLQLNILSGILYIKQPSQVLSSRLQERFMALSQNFISFSVPKICEQIREKMIQLLALSLKEKFTITQLEAFFQTTLLQLDLPGFQKLIIAPDGDHISQPLNPDEHLLLDDLINNIVELLEHEDYAKIFRIGLQTSLSNVFDYLAESYLSHESYKENGLRSEVRLPVAKLIPILNQSITVYQSVLHALIKHYTIREYSANIYESFCQAPPDAIAKPSLSTLWPF